jgi:hypothetical protein
MFQLELQGIAAPVQVGLETGSDKPGIPAVIGWSYRRQLLEKIVLTKETALSCFSPGYWVRFILSTITLYRSKIKWRQKSRAKELKNNKDLLIKQKVFNCLIK